MTNASATISVRVQPRSRHDEIVAVRERVVLVRVVAPPLDSRANDAVRRLLADRLGVPRSAVSILRGHRSRDKVLRIEGLDQGAAERTLAF
ncbi:MAG TPA: DUF167 domain-containing protein [Solirubrobacteraceae bacterium]|nr:DUF167 domain-containing protein [Solirubrobacteraceae bacterium]